MRIIVVVMEGAHHFAPRPISPSRVDREMLNCHSCERSASVWVQIWWVGLCRVNWKEDACTEDEGVEGDIEPEA